MNKTIWTLALATGAHALPSLTTITPMRMRLFPRLSGVGRGNHVALTFDDGPDPEYTPAILAHLEQLGVHATFFLLGVQARRHPARAREIVAAGHEVAVHGYVHRSLLRYGPYAAFTELARARQVIENVARVPVRWWRPPYGILTGPSLIAARRLGLTPVLWTAWGRDWTAATTPESVARTIRRGLRPGGTILLHDSDCTSAPGSSAATVAVLPDLVRQVRARGFDIGPLREHGLVAAG